MTDRWQADVEAALDGASFTGDAKTILTYLFSVENQTRAREGGKQLSGAEFVALVQAGGEGGSPFATVTGGRGFP